MPTISRVGPFEQVHLSPGDFHDARSEELELLCIDVLFDHGKTARVTFSYPGLLDSFENVALDNPMAYKAAFLARRALREERKRAARA